MTRSGWIVSFIVGGMLLLAWWALTGAASAMSHRILTPQMVSVGLMKSNIVRGAVAPLEDGAWMLASDPKVKVRGWHVTIDFDVKPHL